MATLNKTIKEVLAQDDPELRVDQLREGENVLRQEKDGLKVVAHVSNGKISRIAAFDANGKEGTTIRIQPPPPNWPDHVKVCICVPVEYSTIYGEGIDHICWWVPTAKYP